MNGIPEDWPRCYYDLEHLPEHVAFLRSLDDLDRAVAIGLLNEEYVFNFGHPDAPPKRFKGMSGIIDAVRGSG